MRPFRPSGPARAPWLHEVHVEQRVVRLPEEVGPAGARTAQLTASVNETYQNETYQYDELQCLLGSTRAWVDIVPDQ